MYTSDLTDTQWERIIRFLTKLLHYITYKLNFRKHSYRAVISPKAPWVFISYITEPFYQKNNSAFFHAHQNLKETLVMAEVFNSLGYNAYFTDFYSKNHLPNIDCKLIFGHDPNFHEACNKYKTARKIYYAVSTYFDFRNTKIKEMTDEFNAKFDGKVPYRRLVKPTTSFKVADAILLIGNKYTIGTFPREYQSKITKIHQSTQDCNYIKHINCGNSREFFFMGSNGNTFRGVGVLLQYFIKHPELELHLMGTIEKEVKKAIIDKITPNIHLYGFQDIASNTALDIMERCNFMLYPSMVEGIAGSVLNGMKNGLIPLVTPYGSFDGIENYGFIMQDATVEEIDKAVQWALSLSNDEIERRKKECQHFVLNNFNLDRFRQELYQYMKTQLSL